MASVREKELDSLYKELEAFLGKGAGRPIPQREIVVMPRISTGSLTWDKALGGGIPRGRIIEIFGDESSGKTTMCLSIIANAQKEGLRCAYIDAECSYDTTWAETNGVDTSKMLFEQTVIAEEALKAAYAMAKSGKIQLIVIDSIAALSPKAALEGEIGAANIGLMARLLSQTLPKLAPTCAKHDCTVLMINQVREKIGVQFGSNITTPGGHALKHWASIRIRVYGSDTIKQGDVPIGRKVNMYVQKNKTAPPFQRAAARLYFESGFDLFEEVLDFGIQLDYITKSGAWYSREDTKFQGRKPMVEWLRTQPELVEEIRTKAAEGL